MFELGVLDVLDHRCLPVGGMGARLMVILATSSGDTMDVRLQTQVMKLRIHRTFSGNLVASILRLFLNLKFGSTVCSFYPGVLFPSYLHLRLFPAWRSVAIFPETDAKDATLIDISSINSCDS